MLQFALPQSGASINYTNATSGDENGFSFKGNMPDLNGYATQLSTDTSFISIDGGGFPHLSTIQAFADLLHHPEDAS